MISGGRVMTTAQDVLIDLSPLRMCSRQEIMRRGSNITAKLTAAYR
jgi:hypothetical protein